MGPNLLFIRDRGLGYDADALEAIELRGGEFSVLLIGICGTPMSLYRLSGGGLLFNKSLRFDCAREGRLSGPLGDFAEQAGEACGCNGGRVAAGECWEVGRVFRRMTFETDSSSLRIFGDPVGGVERPAREPCLLSKGGPSVAARDTLRSESSSYVSRSLDLYMKCTACLSEGTCLLGGNRLLSVSTVGRVGRQFLILSAFSRSFSRSSFFSAKGKALPARWTRSALLLPSCGMLPTSMEGSSNSLSSDNGNGSSPARVANSGWFKPPMKLMRTASPWEAWGLERFRPFGSGESELSDG